MMYALNLQVFDKPVRCLMSSEVSYVSHRHDAGRLQKVTVDIKRIHSVDIVSIGIEI
jgi:hypothetical protein